MKSNISLSNFLSAEIYKVFHNKLVVMLLLSPLIVYLLVLLYLTFKGWSGLFDYAQPRYTENPWMLIWSRHVLPIFSFMLPLSVTILSYLICEIEFQNDNIRTLLSFPIVRWKSYLSKGGKTKSTRLVESGEVAKSLCYSRMRAIFSP